MQQFPNGWWTVFPGADKLDLTDKDQPVACFKFEEHAVEYGAKKWPGFFEVKQCAD